MNIQLIHPLKSKNAKKTEIIPVSNRSLGFLNMNGSKLITIIVTPIMICELTIL